MAQEGMFWKLVLEDVIETLAEFTNADFGLMWRVKKDKMEVAKGVTWTESACGPRTLQLREYLLREFGTIFVDDRPFHSDSLHGHANVTNTPHTSFFSCALHASDYVNHTTWLKCLHARVTPSSCHPERDRLRPISTSASFFFSSSANWTSANFDFGQFRLRPIRFRPIRFRQIFGC